MSKRKIDDVVESDSKGTFLDQLKERNIAKDIIDKCSQVPVTSLAEFRKLSFSDLTNHFQVGCKSSFIDWKQLEALWSGDDLPKDFVPPIRKQCIKHGIDLKYSDILQKMNVSDLKHVKEHQLQDLLFKEKQDQSNPEETKSGGTETEVSTNSENVDSAVENLRSAVSTERADAQAEKGGSDDKTKDEDNSEDDEKFQAAKEAHLAEAQKQLDAANQMRDNVEKALADMDPNKLSQSSADDLKKKLDSLKEMVKPPSEIDGIGKDFVGHAALMAKLNTKAIFDTSTQYVASYDKDENLFAAVSGGIALTGISVYMNKRHPYDACTLPVLAPPDRVMSLGVFSPFESEIIQTTSESEAANFQSRATSVGMSMAKSMHSSASASVEASGWGVSGGASVSHAHDSSSSVSRQANANSSAFGKSKTQTAQLTEFITMPMKTIRIPRTQMKLSEEALVELKLVDTNAKATAFLHMFGSHVSQGRHTLGGVFFRKISMTSETDVSTTKMFASAGEQLSKSSKSSTSAEAHISGGYGGFSGSAAASGSSSVSGGSSCGSTFASSGDSSSADTHCTYQYTTRCIGPNATTPEDFAKLLQAKNGAWACIDRGDPSSLLPIWEILALEPRPISIGGMSNRGIADLLQTAWMGILGPGLLEKCADIPSVKGLWSDSSVSYQAQKDLSRLIIDYAKLTYRDADKLKVLKSAVQLASKEMTVQRTALNGKSENWIHEFLQLSANHIYDTSVFESLLKQPDGMVSIQNRASSIGSKFLAADWSQFPACFESCAASYWMRLKESFKTLTNMSWTILDFLGKITYKDTAVVSFLKTVVENSVKVLAAYDFDTSKLSKTTWITDFLKLGYNQLNASNKTLLDNLMNRPAELQHLQQEIADAADQLHSDDWGQFAFAFAETTNDLMTLQKSAYSTVPANGSRVYIKSNGQNDWSMDVHNGNSGDSFKMFQSNQTAAQKFNVCHTTRGLMFVRNANANLALDKNGNFGDTCWLCGKNEMNNNQVWIPYKYRDMTGDDVVLLNMGNYDWALTYEDDDASHWVKTCETLKRGNTKVEFHFQTF